jgi:hypothetical protein
MKYRMIVRRTLFDFTMRKNGALKLRGVRFLRDSVMEEKRDCLFVETNGRREMFVSGRTLLRRLSREQFVFVIKAARFFGYLPEQKNLPIYLWADTHMTGTGFTVSGRKEIVFG